MSNQKEKQKEDKAAKYAMLLRENLRRRKTQQKGK